MFCTLLLFSSISLLLLTFENANQDAQYVRIRNAIEYSMQLINAYNYTAKRKRVQENETSIPETSSELVISANQILPFTVLCRVSIQLAGYGRLTL